MAKKFNECDSIYVVDFDNLHCERIAVESSVDGNGNITLEGKYKAFKIVIPSYAADKEQYDNVFTNRDAVREEMKMRELKAENQFLKLKIFRLEF